MQIPIEQNFRQIGKRPHIISLMLLSAFAAMGAILMTPALPLIAKYFNTSMGLTQLTVTSFLLGYALGQLMYGPIANRFGRKAALYIGIVIATLGSLFSIISSPVDSFHLLIAGRFFEALGSSAGLAVCFTVINDFYFQEQARRITAMLMLAFAIVPGIAITIGGALTQYIGWQSCFYFLLFYGFLLIIPVYRLPETLAQFDYHALHYQHIFKNYWKALRNRNLIGYALLAGFSTANIYVFGAEGPFIGIHLLNIPPATYGLWGLTPFIGTLGGSLIAIRLSRIEPQLVLKIGFLLQLVAAIIMLLFFIFHIVTLLTLLLPMTFLCIGHPILLGTALSLANQQSSDKANGCAVTNFYQMSMPVLMTLMLSTLHISQAWIMPLIFLTALFLIACVYCFLLNKSRIS